MEITAKTFIIYKASNGKHPYLDWFDRLKDNKAQAIILKRLDRIATGLMGDCQSLGGNLFELRIHYGPGFRIYFAQDNDQVVLLLLGGDKSTQAQDIQKAKDYYSDFKSELI